MTEIQCTSCNTRYRIDERVLPDGTPTFKCSRCGHVFSADPSSARPKPADPSEAKRESEKPDPSAPGEPRAMKTAAPRPPVPDRLVLRPAGSTPAQAAPSDEPTPPASAPPEDLGGHVSQVKRDALRKGENLRFDFGDDHELESDAAFVHHPDDDWKVGDEDTPLLESVDSAAVALGSHRVAPPVDPLPPRRVIVPDDAAFLQESKLHSSGFFLGLFFAMALLFTGASVVISAAPAASADLLRRLPVLGPALEIPATLESMVDVDGVQTSYQSIKDGHLALVVSGQARNASGTPLHIVQIEARLADGGQRELSSGATYCGNALSHKMLAEMSPHEIEFLQRLDPQKGFVLKPAEAAPFLLVFIDPPKGLNRLSLRVTKAVPAPPQPIPAQNS